MTGKTTGRKQMFRIIVFGFIFVLIPLGRPWIAVAESTIRSTPLSLIPAGTRIDSAKNVSNGCRLVLLANPRVAAGDVTSASKKVREYASMFCMALIAKVDTNSEGRFQLTDLSVGNCVAINDGWTAITANSYKEHDIALDFFARQVLARSEQNLRQARVVAKGDSFRIFDAEAIVRKGTDHVPMIIRHIVWVNSQSGKLATMVWLLEQDGGDWKMVEDKFHALPPKYLEDRVFSVKADEITLGIPSQKAFAINGLPRGKEIPANPPLKKLAAAKSYSEESQQALVAALNKSIREARKN